MKLSLSSKVIALALLLLPATLLFAAADTHKGGLRLGSAVQLGDKQLPAGDYTVKWDGSGPNVQVNIIRDGKVVATAPAQVVDLGRKWPQDSAETTAGAAGNRSLTEIRFEGKSFALKFGGEATASETKPAGEMK